MPVKCLLLLGPFHSTKRPATPAQQGMPSKPAVFEWSARYGTLFAAGGRLVDRVYVWDLERESCVSQLAAQPGAAAGVTLGVALALGVAVGLAVAAGRAPRGVGGGPAGPGGWCPGCASYL